jgi:SAM-dependent methyltransferase
MPSEGAVHNPMQPYWTQPVTYADPQTFDATRYSADNLTFWAPHLIRIGQMTPSTPVLDLGCGTGGFTLALRALTGARVVGVDIALRLLQHAAQKPASQGLGWVQGHAAALPIPEATFARVLISLALHQFPDRAPAWSAAPAGGDPAPSTVPMDGGPAKWPGAGGGRRRGASVTAGRG